MSELTRRRFLTATAAGVAGTAAVSGRVAANHRDQQPAHVTLSYDEATLERYQPLYVIAEEDREKLIAQYAWTAKSPEFDTDAHVYWTSYTHQEGVTEFDSHDGDHEPVYVYSDSQTGDVKEVVASVYHWLAGGTHASGIRIDNGSNPVLRVMTPHHHHTAADADSSTHRPQLENLDQVFDDWLANGMEDDLEPGTVVNPWRMTGPDARTHWWHDTIGTFSSDALIVRTSRLFGVHDAGAL
jgi:hypothetical protein